MPGGSVRPCSRRPKRKTFEPARPRTANRPTTRQRGDTCTTLTCSRRARSSLKRTRIGRAFGPVEVIATRELSRLVITGADPGDDEGDSPAPVEPPPGEDGLSPEPAVAGGGSDGDVASGVGAGAGAVVVVAVVEGLGGVARGAGGAVAGGLGGGGAVAGTVAVTAGVVAVVTGVVTVTGGTVAVVTGSVAVVTGRVAVTVGIAVVTGRVAVTVGSTVVIGSVVVIPAAAGRFATAAPEMNPSPSRTTTAATYLTPLAYPIRARRTSRAT